MTRLLVLCSMLLLTGCALFRTEGPTEVVTPTLDRRLLDTPELTELPTRPRTMGAVGVYAFENETLILQLMCQLHGVDRALYGYPIPSYCREPLDRLLTD